MKYLLEVPELGRGASPASHQFSTEARAPFKRNKETVIGSFKDRLAESSEYIAMLNGHLPALAGVIMSPDALNGALSKDDFHLFATLHAMSIVRWLSIQR